MAVKFEGVLSDSRFKIFTSIASLVLLLYALSYIPPIPLPYGVTLYPINYLAQLKIRIVAHTMLFFSAEILVLYIYFLAGKALFDGLRNIKPLIEKAMRSADKFLHGLF